MAMAASQLASVAALSTVQQLSTNSGSNNSRLTSRMTTRMPAIECAKHAQKKATAHHNKSRPKKHQPYDKNRTGPTYYPPLGKAPPIWGVDTGDASLLPAPEGGTSIEVVTA